MSVMKIIGLSLIILLTGCSQMLPFVGLLPTQAIREAQFKRDVEEAKRRAAYAEITAQRQLEYLDERGVGTSPDPY